MKTEEAPVRVSRDGLRSGRLGALAGLIGISCCLYPTVLVLLGLTTATEAIALGNDLYGNWGWIFKIAGGVFAIVAVVVQLRRRRACTVGGALANRGFILRVVLIGLGVYWAVYAATKALAAWGS